MPGYLEKNLRNLRPYGAKGSTTPLIFHPLNYKPPQAQTVTIIDASPLATKAQQHELQVVVDILLYYAKTVDASILTAVNELGSVQSNPTLQYVSNHQNGATRFYASSILVTS